MNGESVSGKSYAEVVALIQSLRGNLSLIVVPKQDDILQMVSLYNDYIFTTFLIKRITIFEKKFAKS